MMVVVRRLLELSISVLVERCLKPEYAEQHLAAGDLFQALKVANQNREVELRAKDIEL